MKAISTLLLSGFVILHANAQECGTGRYTNYALFPNVTMTGAVVYGSNTGTGGGAQTLRMDVYEPTGDTLSARPVILVGFGGSFISGTRADVADLCEIFARLGYVAIAPDYRVGFFWPTEESTTKAVMRGAHDFRGCIRYLRKTVAEDGNPYKIDPDRIIAGGVSAGAIAALHAAYLDQQSEIPQVLWPDSAFLGNIEGNSGSPGYSSDVLAVYSFSGAIGDTTWIQPGDQPLASVHEDGDIVVPCWTQEVNVIGIPTGLVASGSGHIHQRMDHIGVENCFLLYGSGGHVGYLNSDPVYSVDHVAQFCAKVVCDQPAGCAPLVASLPEVPERSEIQVYPNPTTGHVSVLIDTPATIEVADISGRIVLVQQMFAGRNTVDLGTLPEGLYLLRTANGALRTARVVKMQ